MLVDKTQYLSAGIHIGMKTCTPYMKQFVYKIREDGLAVFDLKQVDERIKTAAGFLSQFDSILAVSRKENARRAVEAFAKAVNGKGIAGRFIPGTLTNPLFKEFYEPDVVMVSDPLIDTQVIKEAKKRRIPIVSLCDTFNMAKDVDYVIPVNNNGRKALALLFWVLAREVQKKKGLIKKDSEFTFSLEDFGDEERPSEEEQPPERISKEKPRKGERGKRGGRTTRLARY